MLAALTVIVMPALRLRFARIDSPRSKRADFPCAGAEVFKLRGREMVVLWTDFSSGGHSFETNRAHLKYQVVRRAPDAVFSSPWRTHGARTHNNLPQSPLAVTVGIRAEKPRR